jgi:hypothetical protein
VVFHWDRDRWVHYLELDDMGRTFGIAQTVEGDHDRDDPAHVVSPVYQQLELKPETEARRALLMGQSGPHHFSAVFEFRETREAVALEVDVADRCRAQIATLACTYQMSLAPKSLVSAGGEHMMWRAQLPSGALGEFRLEGEPSTTVTHSDRAGHGAVVQACASVRRTNQTHRCCYRWSYWHRQNEVSSGERRRMK